MRIQPGTLGIAIRCLVISDTVAEELQLPLVMVFVFI